MNKHKVENGLPTGESFYSSELRDEAIERVINGHESATKVAKDMGVPRRTVSGWIQKYIKKELLEEYPQELIDESVDMVLEDGTSIEEVSKIMDINRYILSNFVIQRKKEESKKQEENITPQPLELSKESIVHKEDKEYDEQNLMHQNKSVKHSGKRKK